MARTNPGVKPVMTKIIKPVEKINSLSKKEAALYYASKGLHVLPLHNPTTHGCSCDFIRTNSDRDWETI